MKAIILDHYGPPEDMKLQEIPQPVPKGHEVLVKIRASSVNAADWHVMRADPFLVRLFFGLVKPKINILGADVAGQVAAVGPGVTRFKTGDEVFGCLSGGSWGAFAEYVCAKDGELAIKPSNATFEQAAAIPLAGMTALQALRDFGEVKPGQKVLVNGASGGVGTFAVQIAKALGAEVTAVCSARNLTLARSIGADHVIDYAVIDFTREDVRYDVILAANGYHPLSTYKRALAPKGRYGMAGGAGKQMAEAIFVGPWLSIGGSRKLGAISMKPKQRDLESLKEFVEARKVTPVIDRSYSLAQVPEAIRYLEEGHARGKVVISIE